MEHPIRLSDQKVLVTGASGFIGTHLCRRLLKEGAEVYGISRNIQDGDYNTLHWYQGDLADMETVRKIISNIKPNIIFHLASFVSGSRNIEHVVPIFQNNLVSTLNLLTVATTIGCNRIIIAGSMEETNSNYTEVIPQSPYAAAKLACSAYARMFHALYHTPVVIARLFMVYGPDQKDLNKLIPYVILSLLSGKIPKLSSGQRLVDWIYIDDVINGLLAIAKAQNIEGSMIDLGTGSLVAVRNVVENLFKLIDPKARPSFGGLQDRPMETEIFANVNETYSKIGWKSMISLEKGLEFTIDWYRNYHLKGEKGISQRDTVFR